MTKITTTILLLAILAGCGQQENTGPYAELLAQEPYKTLTDSIEEFPKESELYFKRAVLLNGKQQTQPALADFQKAWSLDKQEKYALGIGNIWLTTRPDSATHFVKQALDELPKSLFLQLLLARAYEAAGQVPEAIRVCDQIVAEAPDQVNALMLKAELLQNQGNDTEAASTLEQAYALLPGNRTLAEELAYLYAESQNPRALVLTDSLLKVDTLGQYSSPFYIRGNYYAIKKNKAEAIKWYDKTLQRDHRYLNAYIEKGKLYFNDGETDKAMATFQLANTVSPAFADAWYWIGRCQEKTGQLKEAKLSYQKAASLDPDFKEAKEAADKL